jgi:hypothetical protein
MHVDLPKLLSEKRISLNQLARERDVCLSTTWRWCLRGIKGHVLESFNQGGRKFTTSEAFERFLAAINGQPVRSETPKQRERAISRAEKRAAELGV